MRIVGQSGCFAGQLRFNSWHGTGWGNVGAVGGCDVAVGGNEVAEDVAGSTSIEGGGSSGALNKSFGGFFKASIRL
uniref:Uncharacterized protein n=1 Tax=Romanomermis culicivorax TaxID=13658 RepID=A0A915IG18_ROMCU